MKSTLALRYMFLPVDEQRGRFAQTVYPLLETSYLLASAQRRIELEALLGGYMSADPVQREELLKKILTEIRAKQKQHHRFTIAPERPVPIGGSLRWINKDDAVLFPDIADTAIKISADTFFSRTFAIDHR
jgi:hypothetical protein